jgi:hypothetical protein
MTVADNTPNDPGSKMTAVRAIAIVCGFSYDSAYDLLKANGRKCSRGIRLPVQAGPVSLHLRRLAAHRENQTPFLKRGFILAFEPIA